MEKLPGVNIILEHSKHGASSDINGAIEINGIPDGTQIFSISCVGYTKMNITVAFPQSSNSPMLILLSKEDVKVEEVVVTSTRMNSRVEDDPVKVEVLGTEELGEENSIKPGNVSSILGDISGIQIQQTSAVSGISVVRMQGLEGRYTLLLRDGMPAFGGLSGGLNILQIPPLDLRQIEIIKGPASTLHGGGAIAGLINFITKEPPESHEAMLTINQSTLSETNLNGYVSGKNDDFGYTIFSGYTREQAVDVDGDGFSDAPFLRSFQIHPQLFFTFDERTKLRVGLTSAVEQREGGDINAIGGTPDILHYYIEKNNTTYSSGDVMFSRKFDKEREISFRSGINHFQRDSDYGGALFKGMQWTGYNELYYSFPLGNGAMIVGGNYLFDNFENPGNNINGIKDFSESTIGLYTEYSVQIKNSLNLRGGVRADRQNNEGWFVLPSVAMLIHLSENVSIRLNWGSGYKIPDLLELYESLLATSSTISSPASLSAERSLGGTAEWNYKQLLTGNISLFINQTFFYTVIRHGIVTSFNNGGNVLVENAPGNITSSGIDNYIRLAKYPYEVYFGYTYTLPKKQYTTQLPYLPLTPFHRAATTIVDELSDHFKVGVEASYIGYQYKEDGSTTRDYLFLAGMIQYKIQRYTLVLNGENLLDFRQTKYEQVVKPSYPNPTFAPLWAPVDGRVINLSILVTL